MAESNEKGSLTTAVFDGKEGGPISSSDAQAMTKAYRSASLNPIRAVFFGKDILNNILAQEGCMGIRSYFALDTSGDMTLVIVGANADGDDQLDGIIGDMAVPCPNTCAIGSPLGEIEIPPKG